MGACKERLVNIVTGLASYFTNVTCKLRSVSPKYFYVKVILKQLLKPINNSNPNLKLNTSCIDYSELEQDTNKVIDFLLLYDSCTSTFEYLLNNSFLIFSYFSGTLTLIVL